MVAFSRCKVSQTEEETKRPMKSRLLSRVTGSSALANTSVAEEAETKCL
jgi:hypothetical protein